MEKVSESTAAVGSDRLLRQRRLDWEDFMLSMIAQKKARPGSSMVMSLSGDDDGNDDDGGGLERMFACHSVEVSLQDVQQCYPGSSGGAVERLAPLRP